MRFKKMFIPSEGRSNYAKENGVTNINGSNSTYSGGGGGGGADYSQDITKLYENDESLRKDLGLPTDDGKTEGQIFSAFGRIAKNKDDIEIWRCSVEAIDARLRPVENNLGVPSDDPNKAKVDGTAFERIQYNKNLIGSSDDDVTKGSLWGAVNGMEDELYGDGTEGSLGLIGQWEVFEQNWSAEFRKVKNNLGNPEDDGTTAGQTDTAFGRIAKLEKGETIGGYVNSEILEDSSFVIGSPYNDQNKRAFALVQKYMFTQNTWEHDGHIKENLPLWIRDYGNFNAYNVIQLYPEYTEDEHHNYTLTLLTLTFVKTEEGIEYEYKYKFDADGKATEVSKAKLIDETLRKDLGNKTDDGKTEGQKDTAFGRIKNNENDISNINGDIIDLEANMAATNTRLGNVEKNLGSPEDDGVSSEQKDTAFGRIKRTEDTIGTSGDTKDKNTLFGITKGLRDDLGTTGDTAGTLTAFGMIQSNWEDIQSQNEIISGATSEMTKIRQDLGKPTDDGTTAGQIDTAFGRIKNLENGGEIGGVLNPEIIKDTSFYINAKYNDKNIKAFQMVQKYMFTQDTWTQDGHIKENLPLWVRDYGTFDAFNVITMYPTYTEDEHHNYTLTLLTLTFIKTENNVDYEYKYSFNKEGKATQISKVAVHKDISQMETDVTNLNSTVANHTEQITQINTDNTTRDEKVTKLETAVGSSGDTASTDGSLYARIKKNASDISTNADDIVTINSNIENLGSQLQQASQDYITLKNKVGDTGDTASTDGSLYARIAQNKADISTNAGNIQTNTNSITGLTSTVNGHTEAIATLTESNTNRDTKITNLETAVGSSGDTASSTGSLYARTKYNREEIGSPSDDWATKSSIWAAVNNANDNVDKVLEEWTKVESDFKSVKTNLGTNDIPNTTAFGRIAALEAGGGGAGGLAAISDVVEKNTFYLNANNSFSSKEKNVTTYKNMIHYVSQKPKCQVPIYIRPDEDYEGTWNAILVNPHKIDHMKWDGVDVTYCKPDYDGDKKYYLYQVFISQDGSVTDKGKIDIEGGSSLTPEQIQDIYNRLDNVEQKNAWQDESIDALEGDVKSLNEVPHKYNIRLRRQTREGSVDKPYYALTSQIDCIIENYDDDIKNNPNDYRICLMLFKKKNKKNNQASTVYNTSRQWRVPMLADVWDPDAGTPIDGCSQAMRFPWNWTFVNIKGVETPMYGGIIDLGGGSYQQRITLDEILNMKKPDTSIDYLGAIDELSHQFRNNHNRKYDVGWAIFKKTRVMRMKPIVPTPSQPPYAELVEVPVGQKGWTRVSNIARMQLFCTRANFVQVKVMP